MTVGAASSGTAHPQRSSYLLASVKQSASDRGGCVETAGREAVAMPPRRYKRVQLNTRIREDLGELLDRFVNENSTTVQGSVDLALEEFLAIRGYSLPPARVEPPAAASSDRSAA